MFLIERIVSLFVYSLALLGAGWAISISARKQYKVILGIYLLILSAFAYFFVPHTGSDLFRLHALCLQGWCWNDFSSLWFTMKQISEPMWPLFSWTIYNLTHDINWLQTITCLWGFGCIFYIIADVIETNNIRRYNRALLLFSIMCVGMLYIQLIADIRSMLSFCIICFCMYREWIKQKSWVWDIPLYLFAALLHTVGPVLIGMRLLATGWFQKNTLLKIGTIIFSVGLFVYLYFRAGFYIGGSVDKATAYATNIQGYSYIWEIIIGLLEQFQVYLVLYCYYKKHTPNDFHYTQLAKFSFAIGSISLVGLAFSYSIFRRFTIVASILILPVLGRLLGGVHNRCPKLFIQTMWLLCMIIFALSCIRGDLCSYKFFLLD